MKSRIEQINKSLKKVLGQIFLREFPDILPLSVEDVLINPSLEAARVWVRTDPKTFHKIEKKRVAIQGEVERYVKLPTTPKLEFVQDDHFIERIDDLFNKIEPSDQQ